jgi:hypothetical protein
MDAQEAAQWRRKIKTWQRFRLRGYRPRPWLSD